MDELEVNYDKIGTLEDWDNLGYYHSINNVRKMEFFPDVDRADSYQEGYNRGLLDNLHN